MEKHTKISELLRNLVGHGGKPCRHASSWIDQVGTGDTQPSYKVMERIT